MFSGRSVEMKIKVSTDPSSLDNITFVVPNGSLPIAAQPKNSVVRTRAVRLALCMAPATQTGWKASYRLCIRPGCRM